MHPVIRLLSLLVLAALVPWLPDIALLAAVLVFPVWGLLRPAVGRAMWRGVRRIRWLLLSLTVVYLWFSPGTPVLPVLGDISPTTTGLTLAARHGGVLLVMVSAATALLSGLRPNDLAAALRCLLAGPLRTTASLRFADRVGLLFAELPKVERHVAASLGGYGGRITERAASLLRSVEREASLPADPVESLALAPVPRMQWCLPPLLLAAGLLAVFLVKEF